MIIDNNSNDVLMLSLTWEQFIIPNNINDIFSHTGISDYTKNRKPKRRHLTQSCNNIYNVHDVVADDEPFQLHVIEKEPQKWKCHNREGNVQKLQERRHRIILNSPFLTTSVVSYGLKVYARDTKRWAVVQNKHTVEFLLIIRGLYRPTFLRFLLSRITMEECLIIKKCLIDNILTFNQLFLNELMLDRNGLLYAFVRMAESRETILTIIDDLDLSSNKLDWCWPKGRPLISLVKESTFECAKREFCEEIGIDLPPAYHIFNETITEFHITITGRKIESKYWIYVIDQEISMPFLDKNNNCEVANRCWVSTDLCYKLIPRTTKYQNIFNEIEKL